MRTWACRHNGRLGESNGATGIKHLLRKAGGAAQVRAAGQALPGTQLALAMVAACSALSWLMKEAALVGVFAATSVDCG